jgi:hypothetical protein
MNKPELTSSAAVLLVKDVFAAANHYRNKLGFGYDGFFGEPPSFCILNRDDCYLMLKQANDPKHVVPHWTVSDKLCNVYFWVTDADGPCREFKELRLTTGHAISLMVVVSLVSKIWLVMTLVLDRSFGIRRRSSFRRSLRLAEPRPIPKRVRSCQRCLILFGQHYDGCAEKPLSSASSSFPRLAHV